MESRLFTSKNQNYILTWRSYDTEILIYLPNIHTKLLSPFLFFVHLLYADHTAFNLIATCCKRCKTRNGRAKLLGGWGM